MQAYIRKQKNGRFRIFLGAPENHKSNDYVVDPFLTRRQAMRYAKKKGYDIIVKDRYDTARKESEDMKEYLEIKLSNLEAYENNTQDGVWLQLPVDADDFNEALGRIGVVGGEHGMDYYITDFSSSMPVISNLPIEHIRRLSIDELNYIAGQLEKTDPAVVTKLNDELEQIADESAVHRMVEVTQNSNFFKHLPEVRSFNQLGQHYLDSGRIQMPEEWKGAVNVSKLGQLAAVYEKGVFTNNGYVYESGEAWKAFTEIPEDYRVEGNPKSYAIDNVSTNQLSFDSVDRVAVMSDARTRAIANRAAIRAAARGKPIEVTSTDAKEIIREITERMEPEIKDIYKGELYKTFLDTLSKFHSYSFRNNVLISMQKPDAAYVAGEKGWEVHFNRKVRADELNNGIKILAPDQKKERKKIDKLDERGNPVLDANGQRVTEWVTITVPEFKAVTVYDISQTDGEPLHKLDLLKGNVDNYEELFSALEKTSPASVMFVDNVIGGNGYFNHDKKQIIINSGMSEQQNLKTLIHEIAHARLHDKDANAVVPDEKAREIQAESIAYTVCKHYGIDTSQYSFNYIAMWSSDKQLNDLKVSLGIIRKESNQIITEVNNHLQEIQAERSTVQKQNEEKKVVKSEPLKPAEPKPETYPRLTKPEIQDYVKNDMTSQGRITEWTKNAMAANGYKLGAGRYEIVKDTSDAPKPPLEPRMPKTPTKTEPKPEKKGIRSELAAAKKQAETQKAKAPAKEKSNKKDMELG